jgi:hypothetical protein
MRFGVARRGSVGQGSARFGLARCGRVRPPMAEEGNCMSVFKGGLPYGPEVKRLREMYPVPKLTEGLRIPHEQLEGILNEKRSTGRYYGVINSWITRERNENGIFICWEPSKGLKILNPAEILMALRFVLELCDK